MNNYEKVVTFNKILILVHYFILFAFSIPLIIIYLPYGSTISTIFIVFFWYVFLGANILKQIIRIQHNETEIIFTSLLGKTLIKWEEINAFLIYHYGRDVFLIKTNRTQIKIDTYYCRKQAEDIQYIIVRNSNLVKNKSSLILTSFLRGSKQ